MTALGDQYDLARGHAQDLVEHVTGEHPGDVAVFTCCQKIRRHLREQDEAEADVLPPRKLDEDAFVEALTALGDRRSKLLDLLGGAQYEAHTDIRESLGAVEDAIEALGGGA